MKPMRFSRRLAPLLLAAAVAPWQPAAAQQGTRQPTVIILVRHAEKDRSNPSDANPDLTAAGHQRARDLERVIRRRHVNAIITTHLKRAVLTAQPSADSFHITPEVYHPTSDGKTTGIAMAEMVRARHMGQTVLVVGHSNTISATIEALGGPKLNEICDSSSSNLFMLVLYPNRAPRLTHTHYGAADPPGGPDCVDGLQR